MLQLYDIKSRNDHSSSNYFNENERTVLIMMLITVMLLIMIITMYNLHSLLLGNPKGLTYVASLGRPSHRIRTLPNLHNSC